MGELRLACVSHLHVSAQKGISEAWGRVLEEVLLLYRPVPDVLFVAYYHSLHRILPSGISMHLGSYWFSKAYGVQVRTSKAVRQRYLRQHVLHHSTELQWSPDQSPTATKPDIRHIMHTYTEITYRDPTTDVSPGIHRPFGGKELPLFSLLSLTCCHM